MIQSIHPFAAESGCKKLIVFCWFLFVGTQSLFAQVDTLSYKVFENIILDNPLIGTRISALTFDNMGNMAFVSGGNAWLRKGSGKAEYQLKTEDCRPGGTNRVSKIIFTKDGEVLVLNYGNEFYWFNLSGKCLHYFVSSRPYGPHIISHPGRVTSHYDTLLEYSIVWLLDKNGVVLKAKELINIVPFPIYNMRTRGGGFEFLNGKYFISGARSSSIIILDGDFEHIKTISYDYPETFNLPSTDISYAKSQDIMAMSGENHSSVSLNNINNKIVLTLSGIGIPHKHYIFVDDQGKEIIRKRHTVGPPKRFESNFIYMNKPVGNTDAVEITVYRIID